MKWTPTQIFRGGGLTIVNNRGKRYLKNQLKLSTISKFVYFKELFTAQKKKILARKISHHGTTPTPSLSTDIQIRGHFHFLSFEEGGLRIRKVLYDVCMTRPQGEKGSQDF